MISILEHDFSHFNQFIAQLQPSKIFILCDENTHDHCVPTILGNLETHVPIEILEIEAGEEMKNIETSAQLWSILAEFQADRRSLILNVGGGVITDLGGFIASTYKRGIKFINIPTSLLGMCDASIGGKTGIDHSFLKNIVGTFAMPEKIFVYPNFLKTLPFEELRSGFAEMLKHGLIADANHWKNLISIDTITPENVAQHIETSMTIKQSIVDQDFKEQNIRKNLNFGHTIGHAIESIFLQKGNVIPHGEAVAAGMICETHLAFLEGLITESFCLEIVSSIKKYFPKLLIDDFSLKEMLALMINDKKNVNEYISFSLINGIGTCVFDYHCSYQNIISSIKSYSEFYYSN